MKTRPWILILCLCGPLSRACIWDTDTLAQEKRKSQDMANVILGKAMEQVDSKPLRERIAKLTASPRENDPAWWNDLAGAYLRLGEAKQAAELLEKVVKRFPNDYGIHANLGTAYHLLGRYADAEREIVRDLEINPDAHFGLEKYHLALLQYLMRDHKYQSRHVYVDEFTARFFSTTKGYFQNTESCDAIYEMMAQDYTNGLTEAEAEYESLLKTNRTESALNEMHGTLAALDTPPSYRGKWNLGHDAKLEDGVIYMASLNPKEPACFTALGVVSWSRGDLNLAAAAFEKALSLGSPQSEILKLKTDGLRERIQKGQQHRREELFQQWPVFVAIAAIVGAVFLYLVGKRQRKLGS